MFAQGAEVVAVWPEAKRKRDAGEEEDEEDVEPYEDEEEEEEEQERTPAPRSTCPDLEDDIIAFSSLALSQGDTGAGGAAIASLPEVVPCEALVSLGTAAAPDAAAMVPFAFAEVATPPPGTPVLDSIADKVADMTYFFKDDEITELTVALQELVARWLEYPRAFGTGNMLQCAYVLFDLGATYHATEQGLRDLEYRHLKLVMQLHYRLVFADIIKRGNQESPVQSNVVRVMESISNMANAIRLHNTMRYVVDQSATLSSANAMQKWELFLSSSEREELESKYQKFLLYLLKTAYQRNLRKYNGRLYRQVVVEEPGRPPYRTHAWVQESSMSDFVYGAVRKERDYEMWLNMTASHANPREAIKHLENCNDFELEPLKPNRHVFSFRNCVYDADIDVVYAYADPACAIPSSLVAAKYFPTDFPVEWATRDTDWRDIPTPKLDSILVHQKIPTAPHIVKKKRRVPNGDGGTRIELVDDLESPRFSAMDWFYVFIGRMIYEIHEYDDWQVLLFIKGVAGSGKSTIGKLVSYMYDANDVGVLSNNTEKKFGLSALVEKLIYVCYEVKNDFALDQGEFQCMVSGEQMSIPFKHEMAQSVTWKTHGMFMGNEVASWCDNSGSMSRRIVLGIFKELVTEGNPKLFAELQAEIGYILLKSNLAYREAAFNFGEKDIWNVLPDYFWENRRSLRAETHALAYFFEQSDRLMFEANTYILLSDLKDMMDAFLARDGAFKTQRKGFTADFYQWVMDAYHLRVENDTRPYKQGVMTPGTYVTGVCDRDMVFRLDSAAD